jgi:putative addiction module CopG family antidote
MPRRTAQIVKNKVKSGAYATESEVIRKGLRPLHSQEAALEKWLQTEGVARYDAYHGGKSRGRPAAEVFARLRAHHIEQTKSRR